MVLGNHVFNIHNRKLSNNEAIELLLNLIVKANGVENGN